MNSSRTTFTQLITKSKLVKFDNLKRILKKDSLLYIDNELLDMADDDREKANKEKNYSDKVTKALKKCFKNNSSKNGTKFNFEELEAFAGLTHSISNFIVFPSWMNTGR